MPLRTVHVRVNDAATGQPTPVRIRFTTPDGHYFAPLGRLTDFATEPGQDVGGNLRLDGKPHAYIDGSCEIRLPAGLLHVEIAKGPEYKSIDTAVTLGSGQLALRFVIERWTNLAEEGWYAGDTRAHFLSPHAALLEAAAEGLAVVHLLVLEVPASTAVTASIRSRHPSIPNMLAFSGQRPALEAPGHVVVVNSYNWHPFLGSLALLHCHRPVFPLSFGGSDGREDWTLADWCDQCHRKGGLVLWSCKGGGREEENGWGEVLADLVLGKVDAFEISACENGNGNLPSELALWWQLLHGGFRVPLAGASGKVDNCRPLGSLRTYAWLPPEEQFSVKGWIEAIRSGRTFVTCGPLLCFSVDTKPAGSIIDLAPPTGTVHVHAEGRSWKPFGRLEVIVNGQVAASAPAEGQPATVLIETDVVVPQGGWIACRCWSGSQAGDPPSSRLIAQSSPAYVRVAGSPLLASTTERGSLLGYLEKTENWVRREGRFDDDRQREHLLQIFYAARNVLTSPVLPAPGQALSDKAV